MSAKPGTGPAVTDEHVAGRPRAFRSILAPLLLGVLGAAEALAGCGSSQAPVIPGVVRVVAGENFWGNVAAQIGGRHVRVTSILTSPAADPHLYESDVANAVAVAEAGLVIENGAGYDGLLSGGQQQRLRIAQALAAAQRLSANPLIVLGLSVLFAIAAADGGLLASFQSNVKASVLITSLSFAIYVAARLTGPLLRDRHRRQRQPRNPPSREAAQAGPITAGAQPRHVPANAAATAGQRPSLRTPPPRQ